MKYHPPKELKDFLAAGKPPVYIGFGSLIVDDPKKLTKTILEAAEETGQRVLLSRYNIHTYNTHFVRKRLAFMSGHTGCPR